jgi:hypothetical protein
VLGVVGRGELRDGSGGGGKRCGGAWELRVSARSRWGAPDLGGGVGGAQEPRGRRKKVDEREMTSGPDVS